MMSYGLRRRNRTSLQPMDYNNGPIISVSGVEPECKQVTGRLEYVKVGDCMSVSQLDIHYCEGKCHSKALYDITAHSIEDQCSCCSATAMDSMQVPLHCPNGSIVQHEVFNARHCECLSRKCKP
ncbi:UNVERIFIED_CONTAM: hypothetical protein K2H54_023487 [Gekko kuhli]